MTKTKMKSKGSKGKKEWTGVTKHRPFSSRELKEFYQRNFAESIREYKDRREKFQRMRTFLITK